MGVVARDHGGALSHPTPARRVDHQRGVLAQRDHLVGAARCQRSQLLVSLLGVIAKLEHVTQDRDPEPT